MTSAFLPLGGNVEHQILSRKVMVNMKFELGPLVRWIQCFVYNTKVAKMNIYYLFLYLRISPLKMPDIYFAALPDISFAACRRFFWSDPLSMDFDSEELVMQASRDCSGGGACSKIEFPEQQW